MARASGVASAPVVFYHGALRRATKQLYPVGRTFLSVPKVLQVLAISSLLGACLDDAVEDEPEDRLAVEDARLPAEEAGAGTVSCGDVSRLNPHQPPTAIAAIKPRRSHCFLPFIGTPEFPSHLNCTRL